MKNEAVRIKPLKFVKIILDCFPPTQGKELRRKFEQALCCLVVVKKHAVRFAIRDE